MRNGHHGCELMKPQANGRISVEYPDQGPSQPVQDRKEFKEGTDALQTLTWSRGLNGDAAIAETTFAGASAHQGMSSVQGGPPFESLNQQAGEHTHLHFMSRDQRQQVSKQCLYQHACGHAGMPVVQVSTPHRGGVLCRRVLPASHDGAAVLVGGQFNCEAQSVHRQAYPKAHPEAHHKTAQEWPLVCQNHDLRAVCNHEAPFAAEVTESSQEMCGVALGNHQKRKKEQHEAAP